MKLNTKISNLLLLVFLSIQIGAQPLPRCGTDLYAGSINPEATSPLYSTTRSEIVIPIVFHIVWREEKQNISEEVITSQIDRLNQDFNANNDDLNKVPELFKGDIANATIQFCLARVNPNGSSRIGIIRKNTSEENIGSKRSSEGFRSIKYDRHGGSTAWDTRRYLNVWVGERDDFLGDATFPIDETVNEAEDGIVIDYSAIGVNDLGDQFNLGRTLTHEIGHYLNLLHLHGSQTGCNSDGDFVSDTPRQEGPYFGCSDSQQSSCGSNDMDTNFMQFRDDRCLHYFTKGQVNRMMDALFTYRLDLINSGICNTNIILPPDPLKVAQISTNSNGISINLSSLRNQIYSLQLSDINGRVISTQQQQPNNIHSYGDVEITGIYFFILEFNGALFTRKVFIP